MSFFPFESLDVQEKIKLRETNISVLFFTIVKGFYIKERTSTSNVLLCVHFRTLVPNRVLCTSYLQSIM